MIRIPNAVEYAQLPYPEQLRMVRALRELLAQWADTERIV